MNFLFFKLEKNLVSLLFLSRYRPALSAKRVQIYNCFFNRQAFLKKNQNIFSTSKNNLLHELSLKTPW
jgi:hypothetical protein